jgi:hypothetical protein
VAECIRGALVRSERLFSKLAGFGQFTMGPGACAGKNRLTFCGQDELSFDLPTLLSLGELSYIRQSAPRCLLVVESGTAAFG